MEDILNAIGLSPSLIAVVVGAVIFFERIGKAIPDTATGPLGFIRKASKFLSAYVENKE